MPKTIVGCKNRMLLLQDFSLLLDELNRVTDQMNGILALGINGTQRAAAKEMLDRKTRQTEDTYDAYRKHRTTHGC